MGRTAVEEADRMALVELQRTQANPKALVEADRMALVEPPHADQQHLDEKRNIEQLSRRVREMDERDLEQKLRRRIQEHDERELQRQETMEEMTQRIIYQAVADHKRQAEQNRRANEEQQESAAKRRKEQNPAASSLSQTIGSLWRRWRRGGSERIPGTGIRQGATST